MHISMYEDYLKGNFDIEVEKNDDDFIRQGTLLERLTGKTVPIRECIPRFTDDDYCESFGLQWSRFRSLQVDSKSGHNHSSERLVKSSKWSLDALKGKSVLECGCGPGRFTEIFLKAGARVVSVDMSRAVDVNLENNGKHENLLLMQNDITNMPFFHNRFDYVFCYGVIQHTPKPRVTFESLITYLKPGGKISIDIYRMLFIPTWWTTPKYIWRPITKRMPKEKLLACIQWYIPKYIGFDTVLRRIPKLGIVLTGLIPIPCWNYLQKGYSREERVQHAIMDTFDALSPAHDHPKTVKTIRRWCCEHPELIEVDVSCGGNGVIANATKQEKASS